MFKSRRFIPPLLVLLGAASYGVLSPVFKLALEDGWDAQALTFLQVCSGAVLLWAILLLKNPLPQSFEGIRGRVWLQLVVIGVCGMSLTTLLYNRTLVRLDASLSIVLLFQYAWITILLESIRARKWPLRSEWAAVALIFVGTVLAVGLLERDSVALSGIGILYGLLSAVTYAMFFFLAGFLPPKLESFAKSAVMAAASLVFILTVQGTGTLAGSGNVPIVVWGVLLGVLGTALPMLCFNAGIPKMGAGTAALLGSLELPVAVLAAYIMLGEPLSWWQGAGNVLILAGIAAAQSRQRGSADARPGSEE